MHGTWSSRNWFSRQFDVGWLFEQRNLILHRLKIRICLLFGFPKTAATRTNAPQGHYWARRVDLIDADMRRGYLDRFLHLRKDTPGLSDFLGHEKALEDVLVKGPVKGLDVVLAGRYPPNPSELLMRAEFSELLRQLDEQYDLIIVDAPPALAVTDPVIIGRSVGATIAIARHLETMQGALRAVQASFEAAGTQITGAVLNGFKASESGSYSGHYQYHENYRYSYKSED